MQYLELPAVGPTVNEKYKHFEFDLCRILSSHSSGYEDFCLLGYNAM
jgi:hypothetical protein